MNLMSNESLILPGATLGMFGSGQLGRMFTIAARRLGYHVHVFSPDSNSPTGQVADVEITAAYDDADAILKFVDNVDVITYEFENVPNEAIQLIENRVPVRPHCDALRITQHRVREKEFLVKSGIPVTGFRKIASASDLESIAESDCPAIMKTASSGYDGKGQTKVDSLNDLEAAWSRLGKPEVILEQVVPFQEELSVVGIRGMDGSFAHFGPILNRHTNHILDVSVLGAELPEKVKKESVEITNTVLDDMNVVGVICIEFFMTADGGLLVNEIAPRPHNSGHLTIDAHTSCQFEQQVRTICGLPLGSTSFQRPAAMANLLGDVWDTGEPCWDKALSDEDVKLHLYGKKEPRPGRKMGHLTVVADTADEAVEKALAARASLVRNRSDLPNDVVSV